MKKMKITKFLLITCLALISQLAVIAQSKGNETEQTSPGASTEAASPYVGKYMYLYDGNGNRINSFYYITVQLINKSSALDSAHQEEEKTLSNEINFYPNPTTGLVKVNIQGFDEDLIWNAQIYNTSGNQIYSSRITSSMFQFDLSNQKAGVYILCIQCGNLLNEWKIIKE